jgi:hypothetical protein
MGELRNIYSSLVGKPERKGPFGRPRHKREYTIRMDLREIVWEAVDCIYLAHDRDRSRVPSNTKVVLLAP